MSDVFVGGLCNVQIIVYRLVLWRVQTLKVVNISACECIHLTLHMYAWGINFLSSFHTVLKEGFSCDPKPVIYFCYFKIFYAVWPFNLKNKNKKNPTNPTKNLNQNTHKKIPPAKRVGQCRKTGVKTQFKYFSCTEATIAKGNEVQMGCKEWGI